jgi:PhzF family phenazine biosynthesis protein
MRKIRAFIVNAFTKNGSGGSPTGVVLNAGSFTEVEMQNIADQLAKSHTAFVIDTPGKESHISIRFFTPSGEILNCGHGTIAAHYANAKDHALKNQIVFQQAKEGLQKVEIAESDDDLEVRLMQNEIQFSEPQQHSIAAICASLGIDIVDLDKSFPPILASPGSNRFLIAIRSVDLLNKLKPDLNRLQSICKEEKSIGAFVYVLTNQGPNWEATARMFAPNIGIPEDIINGNSSGCVGAYLLKLNNLQNIRLKVAQGQYFKHDGIVHVNVVKNSDRIDTVIAGKAIIMQELTVEI